MNINLIEKLKENKVLPIIRSGNKQDVIDTVRALVDGGLDMMEVNVENTDVFRAIEEISSEAIICAGGIITSIQAKAAMDAGAKVISSPIFVPSPLITLHPSALAIIKPPKNKIIK